MGDHISISEYDPSWPAAYAAARDDIFRALGRADVSAAHVGSTAVPGLAAKATIDVMLGTADGSVDEAALKAFERLGYGHLGEHGVPGRVLFRKGLPPTHHVHWTTTGSEFWRDQIYFRDFLRTHPAECAAYEELKRGLAQKFAHDRKSYTSAKAGFIVTLLERARALADSRKLVFDLEATCWESGTVVARQEIIEIGAVELNADLSPGREFRALVRPTREPKLSSFCQKLTGITQEEVDGAESFATVLERFARWAGDGAFELCSWSDYDLKQLRVECDRLEKPLPPGFHRHIDLRALYARARGVAPTTTEVALAASGLKHEGTRHRALDDARDVARLARLLFNRNS